MDAVKLNLVFYGIASGIFGPFALTREIAAKEKLTLAEEYQN